MSTRFRRRLTGPIAAVTLAVVLCTPVVGTAASSSVAPTIGDQASAASFLQAAAGVGQPISRSAVLARAYDWYTRSPAYNQAGTALDVDRDRSYRTDCSGFVSMAWHLPVSLTTSSLPGSGYVTEIATSALAPGDALVVQKGQGGAGGRNSGHAVLFDHWLPDRVHFSYYSFGSTPLQHGTNGSFASGAMLSGRTASAYRAYRYKKITDDAPPAPATIVRGDARLLTSSPESGNDQCGWWITSTRAGIRYRSCVHHSVNGWYGGLQVTNVLGRALQTDLYWWDWTVRPDGSDLRKAEPGIWSATLALPAGNTSYVIGTKNHAPEPRCVGVQGRPINTGVTESWGSTPFINASSAHCTRPAGWSSP